MAGRRGKQRAAWRQDGEEASCWENENETNCRRCQKYTDKVNLRLAQRGKRRREVAKQERESRRAGRNRSSPRKTPCVCCSLRGAFDVQ